jgi:hypothetical protein
MKYIEWLWTWIPKLFPSKPKPEPAPVDDIDVSLVHWRGPSGANAKVTCRMKDVYRKGGTIYFTHDKRDWPLDGKCDSIICLFKVNPDGSADGGKFDHDYPDTNSKPLNHMVENGYLDNKYSNEPKILPPVEGSKWALCQVNYAGTERTNFVEFPW